MDPDARVAFVTYADHPSLSPGDALAAAALERRGVAVEAVPWDSSSVSWRRYGAVVVRSTWDYHRRPADFAAWLDARERENIPLWNPASVLRWNARKTYLRELARAGVPTIPTEWAPAGSAESLRSIMVRRGWSRAVVKPVVSANGMSTWRVSAAHAAEREGLFRSTRAASGALVQPYLPEVEEPGEWSLVFIDGRFSHALLKRPRPGEFRVQAEHGGRADRVDAEPELIEQAAAALSTAQRLAGRCLYARVDGCVVDHVLLIMELELLEPSLFLELAPDAAEPFAAAIERTLTDVVSIVAPEMAR